MSKCVKYNYNKETGKSEVIIWDKGIRYRGTSKVHEEDTDVANQFVGLTIAEIRAEIDRNEKKARAIRNEVLKLNERISNLTLKERDYLEIAAALEEGLKAYIDEKDTFAKKLRKLREGAKTGDKGGKSSGK